MIYEETASVEFKIDGAFTHTLNWDGIDGVGFGLCCSLQCDCFFLYMNIHIKWHKMRMTTATYCELMHINLYWSLIGCSLLVY